MTILEPTPTTIELPESGYPLDDAQLAHGARSRRQHRSAWRPRGVSLGLLPGAVPRAPEERYGQADLRGECVP